VRRTWIVARKELLDTLRDSRTLLLAFVLPLVLYPIVFITIGQVQRANEAKSKETTLRVGIAGSQHAPRLPDVFADSKQIATFPVDLGPTAVKKGVLDALIVVPPAYEQAVVFGAPSTIRIFYDETNTLSRRARVLVEQGLGRYREQLLRAELDRLGGQGGEVNAALMRAENVASAQEMGSYILGSLVPYLLVLLIASAASHTAIDSTAGEKERSTLETVLVSAATRQELLLGKFVATATTAAAAGVMGLTGLTLTLSLPLTARSMADDQIILPLWAIGVLLAMIVPVAFLMSATLLAFGCFARSAREGQTFATYFIMCVAVLAVLSVASEVAPKLQMYLLPIVGTTQVQREILAGHAETTHVLLAVAGTFFVGLLGLVVAMRLFANERVMFRQ
jgi:sodium transport system permease protein